VPKEALVKIFLQTTDTQLNICAGPIRYGGKIAVSIQEILHNDQPSKPSVPGKIVLVVDDDPGFRELIAAILSPAGYRIAEAANGSEAIAIAGVNQIDLLITDLVMEKGEGIETIRHFAKHFPAVPIVAMSGKYSYLRAAKALGAAATLVKTDVVEQLLPTLQQTLHG
jgi:CheY-like chemotaxis protein